MDTFVLRIWVPADETGGGGVASAARGTAQHVGSGRSGIFRDDAQLLRLLDELRTAAATDCSPEGSPAAPQPNLRAGIGRAEPRPSDSGDRAR